MGFYHLQRLFTIINHRRTQSMCHLAHFNCVPFHSLSCLFANINCVLFLLTRTFIFVVLFLQRKNLISRAIEHAALKPPCLFPPVYCLGCHFTMPVRSPEHDTFLRGGSHLVEKIFYFMQFLILDTYSEYCYKE